VNEHVREVADQDGQRAKVIVMGVRDDRMIDVSIGMPMELIEIGYSVGSVILRVSTYVKHDTGAFDLQKMTAGTDGLTAAERKKFHQVLPCFESLAGVQDCKFALTGKNRMLNPIVSLDIFAKGNGLRMTTPP
jgi:hypothetical protein